MRQRWPLIRIITSVTAARSMRASEHKGNQFGNTFAELELDREEIVGRTAESR